MVVQQRYLRQQGLLRKGTLSLGTQQPTPPVDPTAAAPHETNLQAAETQAPRETVDAETHRHYGHPEDHPVGLRHRKASQDPLHKEEDGLYDQFKELRDKANRGECSPAELIGLREVQGKLASIQHERKRTAQALLQPHSGMAGATQANMAVAAPAAKPADAAKPIEPLTPAQPAQAREQPRGEYDKMPQGSADETVAPPSVPKIAEQPSPGRHAQKAFTVQKALSPDELRERLAKEANETSAPGQNPNPGGVDPAKTLARPPQPIPVP